MKLACPQINLLVAWLWIVLGFVSGLILGLFFHGENWLGGYASFKRRLYRLGHISFFGLGVVNLAFYFTAITVKTPGHLVNIASWAFVIGAISMPVCCAIMAHVPKVQLLFGVPVLSLVLGGVMTVLLVVQAQSISNSGYRPSAYPPPDLPRAVVGSASNDLSTGTGPLFVSPVSQG